jgi:hypothetical protein
MVFKLVNADNGRAFIAAAGLKNTLVPDSTRAFTGYLFGAKNYKTITWAELQHVVKRAIVHPFLKQCPNACVLGRQSGLLLFARTAG